MFEFHRELVLLRNIAVGVLLLGSSAQADPGTLDLSKAQPFPNQCIGGQFCGGNLSALTADLGVNVVLGDLFFKASATSANPGAPVLVNVSIDGQFVATSLDVTGNQLFHQVPLGQHVGRVVQITPATFDAIQLEEVVVTYSDFVVPPPPPPSCQEYDQGGLKVPGKKKKSKTVSCPLGNQHRVDQRFTGTSMPCKWSKDFASAKLTCENTHSSSLDADHVYITCCTN